MKVKVKALSDDTEHSTDSTAVRALRPPSQTGSRISPTMSVQVSLEELEYLRTAPAKAIHRSNRPRTWGRPRAPTPTPKGQDEVIPAETSQDTSSEQERWREYCEYVPGSHVKLTRGVKRLWSQMTSETEGFRDLFRAAGRGVLQMGMVWGGGFYVMRSAAQGKKTTEW